MLIDKVPWVVHMLGRSQGRRGKAPIYSIDFHPDGSRFATGGGDYKARIWSTKSLLQAISGASSSEEEDEEEEEEEGGLGKKGSGSDSDSSSLSSSSSSDSDEDEDDDDEEEEEGNEAAEVDLISSSSSSSSSSSEDEDQEGGEEGEGETGEKRGAENSKKKKKRKEKEKRKKEKEKKKMMMMIKKKKKKKEKKEKNAAAVLAEATSTPATAAESGKGAVGGGRVSGVPQSSAGMAACMGGSGGASAKPAPPADPRQLAILSSHTAPVNSVRWSHKGRFLASASDDYFVFIWEQSLSATSVPFGEESAQGENAEYWNQTLNCVGHTLPVVDIAWVSDDSLLASASLDTTINIWAIAAGLAQGKRSLSPLVRLEGHQSLVKGLCWDPVGKYLASSSQDQTLLVWRTSDWGLEARITAPFADTGKQETLFRRISWSPDGGTICATNASKGGRHVAALLQRGTAASPPSSSTTVIAADDQPGKSKEEKWIAEIDLVGHERPVTTARFSPLIFQPTDAKRPYTVVALGDDDTGLLTLWSSARAKPMIVFKEAFQA
ncbi:hypothetical protein VYU27_007233 [Nannochloropsis oceanica]